MDEILVKLNEYAVLAEQAIADIAPEVWGLTLGIIRAQGAIWTICGVVLLLAIAAYWKLVYPRLWKLAVSDKSYDGGFNRTLCIVLSSIGSGLVFLAACDIWLFEINAWLSLIEPKAALVYRIGEQMNVF